MGQKKLKRFAEIETFTNVLQYPPDIKGKWKEYFKNERPITLELACGKGEYAIGLAQLHPERNFIGVDIKGNRLWAGAKKAMLHQLQNVAFLRSQIDKLPDYFTPHEIEEIWITFPDPQLRMSRAKRRLTHPKFLRLYSKLLKPGGRIHLKTDSPALFDFTKLVIRLYQLEIETEVENLYRQEELEPELKIKTHYEALDIAGSNKVHYLRFTVPEDFPDESEDQKLKSILKKQDEEVI